MKPLLVAVVIASTLAGCGKQGGADEANVRSAFAEYDAAVRARNLEGVKARVSGDKAGEFGGETAPRLLDLAAQMRPSDARIIGCKVSGERATIDLQGTLEGTAAVGTVSLVREKGAWRIDKDEWSIKITAPIEAPEAAPAPPPPETMPAAVRKIVDRVASSDPLAGSMACMEIGARYQSASAFLKEVRPALWDSRPVRFIMVEESFKGGGKSFRYFTAKVPASGQTPVAAKTVGEALCYHLWQYEDVSNSGFKGSFAEWWAKYAPPKGLPAFH